MTSYFRKTNVTPFSDALIMKANDPGLDEI